jgi:hypothetical protein
MLTRHRWRIPAAAFTLALATAACGRAGAASDGVASAAKANQKAKPSQQADPQQAALDFAQCMREHGIDMPDPQADGGGFVTIGPGPGGGAGGGPTDAPPGLEQADAACRHFLEDAIPEGSAKIDPADQDRALKFAQCMREHGVDMPDPDFSRGGIRVQIGGPGSGGVDPDSQTFKDAQEACGSAFGPAGAKAGPGSGPGLVTGGKARS